MAAFSSDRGASVHGVHEPSHAATRKDTPKLVASTGTGPVRCENHAVLKKTFEVFYPRQVASSHAKVTSGKTHCGSEENWPGWADKRRCQQTLS